LGKGKEKCGREDVEGRKGEGEGEGVESVGLEKVREFTL